MAVECLAGLFLALFALVALKSDFQNIHWLEQFSNECVGRPASSAAHVYLLSRSVSFVTHPSPFRSWDQTASRMSLRVYAGTRSRAIHS